MALTFTNGMTLADNSDAVTNWSACRFSGTGGAPAATQDLSIFKQGTASNGCIILKATEACLIFDYYTKNTATLNLTTAGNEVISMWVYVPTASLLATIANRGMYVIIQSSTETGTTVPTIYSRYNVAGSDTYYGGWLLVTVDTRKGASSGVGGGANLAAVRRIGIGIVTQNITYTVKSENLFVDCVWYGRPLYKVVGDGALTATWADFLTYSISTNQDGMIVAPDAPYIISCGIQFGDAAQANTTTFNDATGKRLFFKRITYYTLLIDSGAAALTINVVAAAGTYTRTTGNFHTDGFALGQTVTFSGFTNSGNNATKVITALTTTVMTVSTTGLVNETGNNNERVATAAAGTYDVYTYSDIYVVKGYGKSDGSKQTSITIGSVVGSGSTRQGVLGGSIGSADVTNITWSIDFQTDKAHLSAVNLYGIDLKGAKGGILLNNDSGGTQTNIISTKFINCGEIDTGTTGNGAVILNCFLIDPLGGTSANRGLLIYDSATHTNNVTKLSCITSGSPATQNMIRLSSTGTYTAPFNAIIFYGTYGGTIYQGENSANNSNTVTISATNDANPDDTKFHNTGATPGTVVVSNDKTITIKVVDENNTGLNGVNCYIEITATHAQVLNEASANVGGIDGIAQDNYNYGGTPVPITIRIRKSSVGGTRYLPFQTVGTIEGTFSLTVVMYVDNNVS
jgi:hypothetical protein